MTPAETEALMRQLDEVIGPVEGDDPKVVKRVRILDAGTALFMRQGYRKTSMDEVAKDAGVAKGTVYLYFAKKIDLVLAAIGREKKRYLAELQDVFDERIPADTRLRRYCVAVLLSAVKMPLAGRLFQGDDMDAIVAELPPALLAQSDSTRDVFLFPMLDELAGPGRLSEDELRDRAKVLVGLGTFSSMLTHDYVLSGLSAQRYAGLLADIVVDGLSRKDNAS